MLQINSTPWFNYTMWATLCQSLNNLSVFHHFRQLFMLFIGWAILDLKWRQKITIMKKRIIFYSVPGMLLIHWIVQYVFCKLQLWDGLLLKVSLIAVGHISHVKSFWVHVQCSEFLGLIFEMLIESCVRQTQHNSLQFTITLLLKTHVNVPRKKGKRNANISLQFSGISASRA